jgi:hypothetical protein
MSHTRTHARTHTHTRTHARTHTHPPTHPHTHTGHGLTILRLFVRYRRQVEVYEYFTTRIQVLPRVVFLNKHPRWTLDSLRSSCERHFRFAGPKFASSQRERMPWEIITASCVKPMPCRLLITLGSCE